MLKIKDNVDLKELEKYGFKIHKTKEWYCYDVDKRTDLFVKPLTKQIIFTAYDYATKDVTNIDVLYDLIKADLVEKVDE
jgi:hypothetical protein